MNILHVNCNYMTTALHQTMIEHLDKYTKNAVYCPVVRGGKMVIKPNPNVKIDECFTKIDRLLYFVKQEKIYKSVQLYCDINKFDIIHAYTLMTDGNCAMRLSQKYGIPFVVAVRDTDINVFFKYKPYLIPLAIRIMEKASKIFFLSESYRNEMIESFIFEEKKDKLSKKMKVIPNGIDSFWLERRFEKNFLSSKKTCEQINVLFVGKLIKRKNIPVVQQAIDILIQRGYKAKFTVVGESVDKNVFKLVIDHVNTKYVPELSKEELIGIYRENDIFCMASLHETFGLVYAEAMSQGLPVLYTRGQGFDRQFSDGIVGYAINCLDPEDIADKIELIKQNYKRLVKNCVQLCSRYDWSKITEEYKYIYDEILRYDG